MNLGITPRIKNDCFLVKILSEREFSNELYSYLDSIRIIYKYYLKIIHFQRFFIINEMK